MYLNDSSDHDIKGGLLRLHSTNLHDLKCYTSDEGRCQKTAASFLKGLLEFEGALAPILAIMVQNDPVSNRMLDDSSAALGILESLSEKLNSLMHYNGENMLDHFVEQYGEPLNVVKDTLRDIGNPYRMMCEIKSLIDKVIEQIEEKLIDMGVERELMGSYR
jgi:inositol hexakisphosphate/diphosphoinositol-pentakisphosphate kinase